MRQGHRGELTPEVPSFAPTSDQSELTRRGSRWWQVPASLRGLNQAFRDGDNASVEAAVVRLSQSRRRLAPLALAVGAIAMLFDGLRLLISKQLGMVSMKNTITIHAVFTRI